MLNWNQWRKLIPIQASPVRAPLPSSSRRGIAETVPLPDVVKILQRSSGVLDYTIELSRCTPNRIASGVCSIIHQATVSRGKRIAIKCLILAEGDDRNLVKRTAREIHAWSKLRHKNILELLGIAIFDKKIAMVSPWMDQGNVLTVVSGNPHGVNRYRMASEYTLGTA
ncbi:hypothetical protein FRC07_004158 [Ceratobasidium sp. 392]|nr:hypothetical protein FRC07_004158 [Ceratobasidium sp. 392]